jgi:hypothetical protein
VVYTDDGKVVPGEYIDQLSMIRYPSLGRMLATCWTCCLAGQLARINASGNRMC